MSLAASAIEQSESAAGNDARHVSQKPLIQAPGIAQSRRSRRARRCRRRSAACSPARRAAAEHSAKSAPPVPRVAPACTSRRALEFASRLRTGRTATFHAPHEPARDIRPPRVPCSDSAAAGSTPAPIEPRCRSIGAASLRVAGCSGSMNRNPYGFSSGSSSCLERVAQRSARTVGFLDQLRDFLAEGKVRQRRAQLVDGPLVDLDTCRRAGCCPNGR